MKTDKPALNKSGRRRRAGRVLQENPARALADGIYPVVPSSHLPVLDTMPVGIVIIEKPDGEISYVNEQALRLYGADPRGKKIPQHSAEMGLLKLDGSVYPPEELPASRALLRGESVRNEELVIRQPDGTRIVVFASAAPLLNENGEVIAAVGIFGEITARKRSEEALARVRDELEARVAKRTADLEKAIARLRRGIRQRRQAEKALRLSKERYQTLFENVPIALWEEDFSATKSYIDRLREQGVDDFRAYFDNNPQAVAHCVEMAKIIDVNRAAVKLHQAQNKDELLRGISQFFNNEAYGVFKEELISLAEGDTWFESEIPSRTMTGEENQVHLTLAVAPGHETTWSRVLVSAQDITRRKELERHSEVYSAILKLFLEVSSQQLYLEETVKLLRRSTGCRCVGIRGLDERENIPYVAYEGFSQEFLATESHLSLQRDQCACIRVIAGRLEAQDAPAITHGGSFCCNDITGFISRLTTEQEARFRGVCVRAGFETVAIVPIRYVGRAIGAIHIADERKGALPERVLQLVESIAPLIGEALYRFHVEQKLRKNETSLAEAQRIAHVGNWEWDIVNNELRWSDEIYRIFGLAPQQFEATYDAFLGYVHPDDSEFVRKSVEEALFQGKPYDIDHRIVLPDGSVRVVHEKAEVAYDGNGRPVRMVGTVHDITEHKRAEEELRTLSRRLVEVQEEERRVIARDLHDQTGQSLTMLSLLLERAVRSPEKAQSFLSEAKSMVKEVMGQVREMSLSLRPSILDDLGLLPALVWHFQRFTEQTGINVNFEHSGLGIEFPWDVRTAAYRIVQEALNNVARYADVKEVWVRASVEDNTLLMRIEDHGAGFNLERVASSSSGIKGMKERASLSGGCLAIKSTLGVGTDITVELPLPPTSVPKK